MVRSMSCPFCHGLDLAETTEGRTICLDCEMTWGGKKGKKTKAKLKAAKAARAVEEAKPIEQRMRERFPHSKQVLGSYENLIWSQKDGSPIRVGDMTPRHAFYSYRMVIRGLKRYADSLYWSMFASGMGPLGPSGDAACDAFESALNEVGRLPLTHAYREDIVKALFLRSLDIPTQGEMGGVPIRYEGVPEWDRWNEPYEPAEQRWAACTRIGSGRWRQVLVGGKEAAWAYVREAAKSGQVLIVVRFEYLDPTTGVYTQDKWERDEVERQERARLRGAEYQVRRYATLSPSELAANADERQDAMDAVLEDHYRYGFDQ